MTLPEGTKLNLVKPDEWNGALPVEVVTEIAEAAKRSLQEKVNENAVAGVSTTPDEVFSHLIVTCIMLTATVIRQRYAK